MENEAQNNSLNPQRSDVGFPEARKEEKKSKKLPLIIVVVLVFLLLAGGGYFLLTKPSSVSDEVSEEGTTITPTQASESPTPTAGEVNKKEISIEVLNGTSISGLAGNVKTALTKLGYTDIKTGNASSKDYETTEVKFASSVPTSIKDEILAELNKTYQEVKTASGAPSGPDIQIITGFPKGHTATPTAKATVTPTAKPTGSVTTTPTTTGSVTVTPTKTPTPTPTV